MSNNSFELLAKSLINTNKNVLDLSLVECKVEDDHIKHFCKTLTASSMAKKLAVYKLQLSNNCLKSLCVIDLVYTLHVKQLYLNGNQIQSNDILHIMEALRNESCHLKYIDLQNNQMSNVDDHTKKYFFILNFNFTFITTINGIVIIAKELLFNVQLKQDIIDFYLAIVENLPEQGLQGVLQIINASLSMKRLYITVFHHKCVGQLIQATKSLMVSEELYLCIPEVDITSADELWQNQCKSKLILSKEALHAIHIEDNEVLCKTLCNVTANSKITSINIESSNLCYPAILLMTI